MQERTNFIQGKEDLMAEAQDSGYKTPILSPAAHSGPNEEFDSADKTLTVELVLVVLLQ